MTPRERVLTAVRRQEPDRVPFDLGSTPVTGIHRVAYANLRQSLGLPEVPTRIYHQMQQLAVVDDDVHQELQTDVRGVRPLPPPDWELRISGDSGYLMYTDEWGIVRRMPRENGLYYDLSMSPLERAQSAEEVERYPWPSPNHPDRFTGMRDALIKARDAGYATVLGGISSGMMEMAEALRGFGVFFEDLASASPVAEAIVEKILELKMAYWSAALAEAGDLVDIVMEGDDLGGQSGLLISPRTFAAMFRPRLQRLFAHIKRCAPHVAIVYHSCGSVRSIIPDLIEMGVDILNPVQVSARGMEPADLKREFGRDITFWGGGIDTQRILPRCSPGDVREAVRRSIADLAPAGGFVFTPVHNIQADVPAENILAMRQALEDFGAY